MGEKQRKHILISVITVVTCCILFLLLKEIIFPREKMSPEETMIPEETTSLEEEIFSKEMPPEEEISPEEMPPEETMIPEETTSPEETMIPKERNIPSHRVDDTILCLLDVDKDLRGVDYELPEKLTEWIAQSLEEGDWAERLKEISAEYKELSESEKRQYFTEQEAEDYGGLAHYCIEIEPLLLKDKWYLVSLSEYGEDVVIESYDFGGKKCIYCFVNLLGSKVYTEPPMWGEEKREMEIGSPYFISWEGKNYMAVPVWKEESDEILGIEIYDYYPGDFVGVITGIRVDENGERKIRSQEYLFSTPRGGDLGGTRTLEVLFDEEEE